jgi:hypothetical protein
MASKKKHGMFGTPEYRTWCQMRARCVCPTNNRYARYGARGIRVCARWEKFEHFLEDMGRRPSPSHSIERRSNDGHYEPGNCRWATAKEQARNRTDTVRLTIEGVTKPLAEWAEQSGLSIDTLRSRFSYGWRGARLLTPARRRAVYVAPWSIRKQRQVAA